MNNKYTNELETFFKTIYDDDVNNNYSVDELYAKYYEGSLSSTYLYNALDSLNQKDISHFIIDLIREIEFLNNHFQKEIVSESEKQQYELKLEEKNKQIRNKKQTKRIIYKAASRINQRKSLINEIDTVLQEETFEDEFKTKFDLFENELSTRRKFYKIYSK